MSLPGIDALVQWARDNNIVNLPVSGKNLPAKPEFREAVIQLGLDIVSKIAGIQPYETKADMQADTTRAEGTQARVFADPTPANNTIYIETSTGPEIDTDFLNAVAASATTVLQPLVDAAAVSESAAAASEAAAGNYADTVTDALSAALGTAVNVSFPVQGPYAFLVTDTASGVIKMALTREGRLYAQDFDVAGSHVFSRAEVDDNGRVFLGAGRDLTLDVGPMNYGSGSLEGTISMEVDQSGYVISGRDDLNVDLTARYYDAWISGGQVWIYANGLTKQMTADTIHVWVKADVRGGQWVFVRDDGLRITMPLGGVISTLAANVNTLAYSPQYGQSGGNGNSGGDAISTTPYSPTRSLMFNGQQRLFAEQWGSQQTAETPIYLTDRMIHDLVPAAEKTHGFAGETASSAFAYGMVRTSTPTGSYWSITSVVTADLAVGSCSAQMLVENATQTPGFNNRGQPWQNLQKTAWRIALLARMNNMRYEHSALRYNQGEGNYTDDKATYMARLVELQASWQSLGEALNGLTTSANGPYVGVTGSCPLMVVQTCSGQYYGDPFSQVPSAQLGVNLADPDHFLCVGPTYWLPYTDNVHPTSASTIMHAALYEEAFKFWRLHGYWYPLYVQSAVRTGTTVRLTLNNPFGNVLNFDTTTITGLGADQGFVWRDAGDGNAVTVTNAAIINLTTVDLTLSAVPTGSSPQIGIGQVGSIGAQSGPATGNRCTLSTLGSGLKDVLSRDVTHFVCIDVVPVT